MQVAKDTVVTLSYRVTDPDGNLIDGGERPLVYLHGGYDGIFSRIEEMLQGKAIGEQLEVKLLPEDAFGEYDEELVRIEPRDQFPGNIAVGMQFEGRSEGSHQHTALYTVTDVGEDKVVVDGNHPLAGQKLVFSCTVTGVREATQEEIAHGHAHGPHGHHHD